MTVLCYREGENIRCIKGDGDGNAQLNGRVFEGVPPGTYHEIEFFKRFDRSFGIVSKDFSELQDEGIVAQFEGTPMTDDAMFRHWQEPRVIRRRWVPMVDSMDDDGPNLTTQASMRVEVDAKGRRRVWLEERATGPGHEMLMPPELDVEHSYGHLGNSEQNEGAACPELISDSALTLWSDEITGVGTRGIQINLGVAVPGTINPRDGFVIKRTRPAGVSRLDIFATNADGEETTTDKVVRIGDYTLPMADGNAGQVLKTDGAGVLTWQDP